MYQLSIIALQINLMGYDTVTVQISKLGLQSFISSLEISFSLCFPWIGSGFQASPTILETMNTVPIYRHPLFSHGMMPPVTNSSFSSVNGPTTPKNYDRTSPWAGSAPVLNALKEVLLCPPYSRVTFHFNFLPFGIVPQASWSPSASSASAGSSPTS